MLRTNRIIIRYRSAGMPSLDTSRNEGTHELIIHLFTYSPTTVVPHFLGGYIWTANVIF